MLCLWVQMLLRDSCDPGGYRMARGWRYNTKISTPIKYPSIFFWHMCVCVCVFFPFILDIQFVGRTSRSHTGGRSDTISHPPSFCGACLNFSREKDSVIPFPRRPRSRILCTNDLIVLHPLGIFSFLVRKIPFAGIELASQTCQRVTRYF